jgi:hypothetical protein
LKFIEKAEKSAIYLSRSLPYCNNYSQIINECQSAGIRASKNNLEPKIIMIIKSKSTEQEYG